MEGVQESDAIGSGCGVMIKLRLGSETHSISGGSDVNISAQLVAAKEESMRILKEFITKHNVPNDVPDDDLVNGVSEEEEEDDDGETWAKVCVKSKKTKIV